MHFRLLLLSIFSIIHISNSITLDSVIAASDSCVLINWIPDSVNTNPSWYLQYGTDYCTGEDSIYKKCDFIPNRSYNGVAYSYGGEDPWFLFRSRLKAGFLVGSHQCHYKQYNDPSDKVTGTDCSGFLSFVWNVPRVSTSIFYNSKDYNTVSFTEIRAGDALVKASAHAILIVEAEDLKEVVISEASSSSFGCRERLVDLTSSVWSSYKAIRYPGLSHTAPDNKYHHSNTNTTLCYLTIKPGVLFITIRQLFTGTIAGFLPDGRILFKKYVNAPESIITVNTNLFQNNIIFLKLSDATSEKSITKTIALW